MKKNVLYSILCFSFIFSAIMLIASYVNTSPDLKIDNSLRFILLLFCCGTMFYLIRSNHTPQLEPVQIKTEKKEHEDKRNENSEKPSVQFKDVAGLEEVKEELIEVIDFIKNPEKYFRMGAKIPKGILFYGPPGTGKTLLAQAIAGETNSAFFPASGSEFVEKYVGVGAKRVRTLFEKAKKEAPSVIFIDEIDAIGAKRNSDTNNEKDQTLNQLLIEMDGFHSRQTVIVIGATNRLDLLDEALLRPGRFDRHMYIGNPDIRAREEILKVHVRNKPLDSAVNIKEIAKRTHGMSGAHLSNIANEAAILAVRNNKKTISIDEFNQAIEKVIAGLQRKNAVVLDKEKRTVSYHEAGHALIGRLLNTDLISKISIIPRGEALGYVMYSPEEERYLITKEELYNKIKVLLGGRAAEEIVFGEISTGAKDDLKKANNIAYQMVCDYGMSNLSNRVFEPTIVKNCYSMIDTEIKSIIDCCYNHAKELLQQNNHILDHVSQELFERETLSGEELDDIIQRIHHESPCSTAT
ncbi:MAG: ATP-dependent zinc metalloprotease FtsH [Bacillota bacterium]